MGKGQFESRSEFVREIIRDENNNKRKNIVLAMYLKLIERISKGSYVKDGVEITLTPKMKRNREKAAKELKEKYDL